MHIKNNTDLTDKQLSCLYNSWRAMKQRCYQQNHEKWPLYGAKGITVCEDWHTFGRFFDSMSQLFVAKQKQCPGKRLTLGRLDSSGNYCPDNCRFETDKEQARNRSTNRLIEFEGQIKTLAEWAELHGINRGTLTSRLRRGMSIEEALNKPVRQKRSDRQSVETPDRLAA
jgi:hypothetical protein